MEQTRTAKLPLDRDITGAALFCEGASGLAHVAAHRLLDAGRPEEGHRVLSQWLDGRQGTGSEWTHIQWHMAVFELETGRSTSAMWRFSRQIAPAVPKGDAYTDGPSLLWRLALTDGSAALPWDLVREAAIDGLGQPSSQYVALHHLLALAGAQDVGTMRRWLDSHAHDVSSPSAHVLTRMARGLTAFAGRDYARAARSLAAAARHVWRLGGSRAQNELFKLISQEACLRAGGNSAFARRYAA